ncbi:MAG: hypothetical protein ABIA75_14920 [Candidatus Neomarinimicrobiota bacterium]
MVRRPITIFLLLLAYATAADDTVAKPNPCQSELIRAVAKDGLKSLRFYQLPAYYRQARRCQKMRRNLVIIKKNEQKQLENDFQKSQRLPGFTSSCAYIATVSVVYFYASQSLKKN